MTKALKIPETLLLEKIILGNMMMNKSCLVIGMKMLKVEYFTIIETRLVFETIENLFTKSNPIDEIIISSILTQKHPETNWNYDLMMWSDGKALETEGYILRLIEGYIARQGVLQAQVYMNAVSSGDDVFTSMERHLKAMHSLLLLEHLQKSETIGKITLDNLNLGKKISAGQIDQLGVRTYLKAVDIVILGLRAPDLIILAARPGMGKTAFALTLAKNVAIDQRIPVGVFSLEMSKQQLGWRTQSMYSGLTYNKISSGKLHANDILLLEQAQRNIEDAPMYIDDTAGLTATEFRAKAMEMVYQHGVKAIFLDYLQLMRGTDSKKGSREEEVSDISRTLKAVAKELNIPIVALSQLSRKVEDRGGAKRPQLADLRESGSIEQDADVVMFLWRPAYYKVTSDSEGNAYPEGFTELIIAKNRNGAMADCPVRFMERLMEFKDIEFESDMV